MSILIYGATGYVGALIAETAVAATTAGDLVLGGRSDDVGGRADALGLGHRVGPVDDIDLSGIHVVINAAGPFSLTASRLAAHCIASGAHYVDLAGETPEFDASRDLHDEALAAGVTLMPGVGFGVVPTDCLALHLATLVPTGVALDIAFATTGGVSGGTLRTMAAGFGDRGHVSEAELRVERIEFESGTKRCIENPWRGDLVTAPISTGIDDVTTWISLPAPVERAMASAHRRGDVDRPPLLARLIRRLAARAPAGPSPKALQRGRADVWAQITDRDGTTTAATLSTPDAYLHSADAALACARRLAAGDTTPGFRTPAQEFGADFVLELPGVTRHTP